MNVIGVLSALAVPFIWAYVSTVYKRFMESIDPLTLNMLRTTYAFALLTIPMLIIARRLNIGALWAALSGLLSLVVGDSLYLTSINLVGVSVAVPLSYTYILLAQVVAIPFGISPSPVLAASGMVMVVGIYLLSRSIDRGVLSSRGVLAGIGAALSWAVGQFLISLANSQGLNPIVVAYLRVGMASLALYLLNIARGVDVKRTFSSTLGTSLPLISLADLGLGVALFAYSINVIGFDLAVLITGIEPLVAQLLAYFMAKERLNASKVAGALIIVASVTASLAH